MKKLILISAIILFSLIFFASPALASNYLISFLITETGGNSYANLPICISNNNTWLVDNAFMSSSGRDSRVLTSAGESLPHMVADNSTWVIMNITPLASNVLEYSLGNSPEDYYIIPGLGGYVTIDDNSDNSTELGDSFSLEVECFVKTTAAYIGEDILLKDEAIRIYVAASGNVTVNINNGAELLSVGSLTSGRYIFLIEADGADLNFYVNNSLRDTTAFSDNVTNNVNPYILGSNATPYIFYLKMSN